MSTPETFMLLSRLWLREPDAATQADAIAAFDLPPADLHELAIAYADVFLLNVPPYGTVFTDAWGELNAPPAQRIAELYAQHGFDSPALLETGAPDHLGLGLAFLAHLAARRTTCPEFLTLFMAWVPACCAAVEREPCAPPFYRALGTKTWEALAGWRAEASAAPGVNDEIIPLIPRDDGQDEEEVTLKDVVRYFLHPARCGIFLSRTRLAWIANRLGVRLPFALRFDVAEALFTAAGDRRCVPQLLELLEGEFGEWIAAYRRMAGIHPQGERHVARWVAAAEGGIAVLREMMRIARTTPDPLT